MSEHNFQQKTKMPLFIANVLPLLQTFIANHKHDLIFNITLQKQTIPFTPRDTEAQYSNTGVR